MRNPIRLKNLRARFLPLYVLGAAAIVWSQPTPAAYLSGAGVVGLGIALRSWGAGHLVKNELLTVTGPYAWLRHPLYLGTLLTAVGFAVILGGWLAVAAVIAILPWFFLSYFPRKERSEGARLEALYGKRFVRYRAAVPALLPMRAPWRDELTAPQRWSLQRYSDNNELGTLLAQLAGLGLLALRTFSPH